VLQRQTGDVHRKDLAAWQASGQDKDSLVVDPMFVNPSKGDFHLRDGSPASSKASDRSIGPKPA